MRLPTLCLALLPLPALAEIEVHHPVAVRAYDTAPTGAAYMVLVNAGDAADRLLAASADLAQRTELHATTQGADGTMQMERQDGLDLPAGSETALARGGLHLMLLGLTPGDAVTLTLTFEEAGEVTVTAPWGSAEDAAAHDDATHPHAMDHDH